MVLFYSESQKNCTLAPEKFITLANIVDEAKETVIDSDSSLSLAELAQLQMMDMFSLGCVISEVLLNGTSLFTHM